MVGETLGLTWMSVLALLPKTMIWASEFAGRLDHVRNTVDRDHDTLGAGAGRVLLRNLDFVGAMIRSWRWRHHKDVVIDQMYEPVFPAVVTVKLRVAVV